MIALVGAGRWGENLIRNFFHLGALKTVCDSNQDSLKRIKDKFPTINTTTNFEELLADSSIQGVVISTPAATHETLAKLSLNAGKHVYVEKPLARDEEGANDLIQLAKAKKLTLMVGHLLLYHPAVNCLKNLIANGVLGDIRFLNSDRRNFAKFRGDTNVIWDLAPHDISMISYLLGSSDVEVIQAKGYSTESDNVIDVAHLDLCFNSQIYTHIHNSWIDPQKQCLLTVNGSLRTAVLNDTRQDRKLEIYTLDEKSGQLAVEYPLYPNLEPLRLECEHFLHCIESGEPPLTDGTAGYTVVKILEEADKIIRNNNP